MDDVEFGPGAILTERTGIIVLAVLFAALALLVAFSPYDVSEDLPDATTNAIWVEHYAKGTFAIPFDEWTYGPTQSSVVMHDGEYVVVNEKGPGHALLLVPFYLTGMEFLFGPTLCALGVSATYMLGKRLFGWPVGWGAALLVMFNLSVVVMWHRFYWTDASTMHLVILALWLLCEGTRRLDIGDTCGMVERASWTGWALLAASGMAFGIAVSTRYPTGLLLPAFATAVLGFGKCGPLRGSLKEAGERALPSFLRLAVFLAGLMLVLAPLFAYNAEYFGGALQSGYNATPLTGFDPNTGLDTRNTSSWPGSDASGLLLAVSNLFVLLPVLTNRMPILFLLPLAFLWMKRRVGATVPLFLLAGINLYTYLSLDWIVRYARVDLVPWEPRYFMPALPVLAILGVFGIYRSAAWIMARVKAYNGHESKPSSDRRTTVLAVVVSLLLLFSAVPAVGYLLAPPQAHFRPPMRTVTVDALREDPETYVGQRVRIERAVVDMVDTSVIFVKDPNGTTRPLPVRFVDWPPGESPTFRPGDRVTVEGMFVKDTHFPEDDPHYFIGIKYGTTDRVLLGG